MTLNDVQSRFMYPVDNGFDKHALKCVAKHFKQYRQGLKIAYFNLKRKQKRICMRLFLKGILVMGGCDWLTIGVQNNMRYMYLTPITIIELLIP